LRWFHPTRNASPADFLEIAAATGILIPLERWAFLTVCKNLAAWKNSGMDPLPKISINLSGAQLGPRDWLSEFMKSLNDNGLDPGLISIEISESDLQGCASDSVWILQKMRSMGMQLHVDHFGKSSSQIQSLLTCPVDAIKIDPGVFASNGAAGPLLKVVTAIAKSIGIPSVALGVETSSQMELSRSLDYPGARLFVLTSATSERNPRLDVKKKSVRYEY
jgi:EAL domain-containing protein (putative c-di-GMP-specific phosphodiesterase class I)